MPVTFTTDRLSPSEYSRFSRCPVKCPTLRHRVASLSDYISVLATAITSPGPFWFRGHARAEWKLVASALRYNTNADRQKALALLSEFRRVAEIKLDRPPQPNEELKWVQLAQHYGLPTRLLDWTESATIALYFACIEPTADGLVFLMNPVDLNRLSYPKRPRILDAHSDATIIRKYLRLAGRQSAHRTARNTLAVNPVWNSQRLMLQKGVFTLHGSRFDLDVTQAPSLVALPILKEYKAQLRLELDRLGVDEMTVFPELEHACNFLRRKADLP